MYPKTQSQEVFKKYTGIFAISVDGVIEWDLYEKGGINTDRLMPRDITYARSHASTHFNNSQPANFFFNAHQLTLKFHSELKNSPQF